MEMRAVVSAVRSKVGLAAVGAALLATGVGVGAAAVVPAATDPVSDSSTVTTEPAEPTEPAAPTSAAPVVSEPAPTVEAVPKPEPTPVYDETRDAVTPPARQPAPAPAPAPVPAPVQQDASGVGTTGSDGNYTPAPPVQNPGEPAPGPEWNAPPPPAVEQPDLPKANID